MNPAAEAKVHRLFDLRDKVAIITGGSTGLGFDMACALAEAGCHIIITSRSLGKSDETVSELIREYNIDSLSLIMDQCNHEQVKEMAGQALAWKGHIDILINNAGGGSGIKEGNLFKRSPDDMANLIAVNLTGALFCCQEVGRIMAEQGYGKIINLGSVSGIVGRDRRMYRENNKTEQPVDYSAAKAGVIGMTRDLAAFMAPYGVCVNCISPGGFDKGELPEDFVKAYSKATALGRMGKIQLDIKGAALYLASSASDYVTGHNLVLDGGFSILK